jgi:hypothetical protein
MSGFILIWDNTIIAAASPRFVRQNQTETYRDEQSR